MTGREVLKKAHARRMVAMFGPFVLGLTLITTVALLESRSRRLHHTASGAATITAGLVGMAIILGGVCYSITLMRCPWCRANLGGLVGRTEEIDRIRCCPYCAKQMDEKAPIPSKARKPDSRKPGPKKLPLDDELA